MRDGKGVPEGPMIVARQFYWRVASKLKINRVPEGHLNPIL
jgi:hypothetical protein